MEEEDSILGLAPAPLPFHTDGEESVSANGYMIDVSSSQVAAGAGAEGGSGWSFEHALRAASAAAEKGDGNDADAGRSGGTDDDEDGSSDAVVNGEKRAGDVMDFRDGGTSSGAEGHMDDASLLSITDKKAAKRLGKKLYKQWKKLQKASKWKKDRHKSSKKKGSKKESKRKEKVAKDKKARGSRSSKRKGTKARGDEDNDAGNMFLNMADGTGEVNDEFGLVPAADLSDAAAAIEARLHKASLRESKMRAEKAIKKAAQRKTSSAELVSIAKELVGAMAKARQLDDDIVSGRSTRPGAFPLNRVALKNIVQARCRQKYMVGPLVEAGILQELSYWLYDVDRADPAPYELRTTALDILVSLPMEGSIPMTEDLTAFMGVSREHLIKTDLGRALNALRRYNDETIDNKGKCVELLTSFSRVISGTSDKDQTDERKSKAVWKCQRDPTVASPFEVLETCSEAFQRSFMKPDPRDPTSYNGVLPWRPPVATITNVSDKPTRSRRPLSAAQISARASGASRPQAQRSVSSGGTARAQATTPVYRPLRYVGRGSFGVVVLAEELHTGEKVAIKRVHYDARLHNREVAILNSVLVDDPRHQQTSSTVGGSTGVSRLSGGTIGASLSPSLSPSSSSHTVEDVHLWAGRHHPNIVELLDFYVTYDTSSEQALGLDMVGAGGTGAGFEFLSSHHPTEHRYPLSGGRGPTSPGVLSASAPLSAFAYLEMVMGYLPMDLCYMKKHFFRFHEIPSRIASSSASPLVSPVQAPTDLSSGELPECMAGRPPTSPKHPGTDCKRSSSCCHSSTGTSGGDFRNHLPLNWVKVVLFQLARALAFMHARHVCHRDLKPGNVLVDPHTGRVQLCDFGSAKQIMQPAEEKNVSYICSRYYRAPELLFGALHYGCAVDMWSFGCIAAELLRESGRPLFRGCTSIDQMAELFKVLGAPSKREMYAMNPQCAEALLRTHAMHRNQSFRHRPHSGARGCGSGAERRNRSCGLALGVGYQAEEEEDDELHSGLQQAEYDAENHGDFLRDALDDGILSQASVSPGMATGSQVSSSPTDPRHYKRAFSERPSSVATATLDDVTPTPFEEYYDVLKVRAIPWRMLFPADTPVEAVALVASLLCYTPEKRLTAAEVVEHAFFDDLFSAAAASPETRIYHDTATSMASGAAAFPGEDPDAASAALRLPNGHLMPLSMFQVTEVERGLYTDTFLARMARQAELVAAARKQEEHS